MEKAIHLLSAAAFGRIIVPRFITLFDAALVVILHILEFLAGNVSFSTIRASSTLRAEPGFGLTRAPNGRFADVVRITANQARSTTSVLSEALENVQLVLCWTLATTSAWIALAWRLDLCD